MSNAPQGSTPAAPGWFPSQKIWAGGTSFVIAAFLLHLLAGLAETISTRYGFLIPVPQDPATIAYVAAGVSYLVAWYVPPSIKDVLAQIDTRLADVAKTDKTVAASLITAAAKAPSTQIVTTPSIAAASPAVNVVANTTSQVVPK